MSFKEFIVQILHYAAWPAMIFGVVLLFRERIEVLLKSRMKVRHKDTEVELNIPTELQKKMSKKVDLSELNKEKYTWEDYLDALEQWAFNLGMKITLLTEALPKAKDTTIFRYELEQLKTITDKLEKERPVSNITQFARDVLNAHKPR